MRTDGARGTFSRVRSRTSGLSVNAITLAVRKRKRTWPSVDASRNARSERDGEDDQLDPPRDLDRRAGAGHRADRTVGPARALGGDLATVRAMATPRSRHAARLRADRRGRRPGRGGSPSRAVIARARRRDARADRVRQPERAAPAVSRPAPLPGHLGAAGCRTCSRPSATSGCSRPSRRAASRRSASTGARTARSS